MSYFRKDHLYNGNLAVRTAIHIIWPKISEYIARPGSEREQSRTIGSCLYTTYRTRVEFLSHSRELIVLADRIDPFIVGSPTFVSGK